MGPDPKAQGHAGRVDGSHPSAALRAGAGEGRRWLLFLPTAAALAQAFVRSRKGWADFGGYIDAGKALEAGFYSTTNSNTWPPFFSLVALPLSWLDRLPPVVARLSWASATIAIFALAVRRWWKVAKPPGTPGWVAPAACFSVVQFWIHHTVYHQVYALVFACAAMGFVEAARGRDVRAGIWIGLGGAAKVTPALALLYFVFARRWRLVGAAVATALVCSAALVPFLGVAGVVGAYRRWLDVVATLGGPTGVLNQGLPALIDRWITDRAIRAGVGVPPLVSLDWAVAERIARTASLIAFAALAALLARRKAPPIFAFAPLVGAAVFVAPFCWKSQLIAFLPLVLLTLSHLARDGRRRLRRPEAGDAVAGRDVWGIALAAPFFLLMPEREPTIIGWKTYILTEGMGFTGICVLLLLVQSARFIAARRGAPEEMPAPALERLDG